MRRLLSVNLILFALIILSSPLYSKTPALAEWTSAIFINADSHLSDYASVIHKEMTKFGSTKNLNIITLLGTASGTASINRIDNGKIVQLKDLGEIKMSDYRQLVKFAEFIKSNYPAKRYVFTVWGLGLGWREKFSKELLKPKELPEEVNRGISVDSSGKHITNKQLATAMKQIREILGQRVDILNLDADNMQLAEVNFELMGHADYLVSSPYGSPDLPYAAFHKALNNKTSSADAAKQLVKSCTEFNTKRHFAVSAVNLVKFPALLKAIDDLARVLMSQRDVYDIINALKGTQFFGDTAGSNIDLLSFVQQLKKNMPKNAAVQTACDNLIKVFPEVIIENTYKLSQYHISNGMAIYFPFASWESKYARSIYAGGWSNDRAEYKQTSFAKKNLWAEMIDMLSAREQVNYTLWVISKEAGKIRPLQDLVERLAKDPNPVVYNLLIRDLNYALYTDHSVHPAIEKGL